jgi:hypothetical protein
MTERALHAELVAALTANTAMLRAGLHAELARRHTLEPGRPLQFEADPWTWDISSCATEEPITDEDWLSGALLDDWFERAEAAGVNWDGLLGSAVCPWFADCWQLENGPARFSPAYLFLHGYHDQQYHLETRCWVSANVALGEGRDTKESLSPSDL